MVMGHSTCDSYGQALNPLVDLSRSRQESQLPAAGDFVAVVVVFAVVVVVVVVVVGQGT